MKINAGKSVHNFIFETIKSMSLEERREIGNGGVVAIVEEEMKKHYGIEWIENEYINIIDEEKAALFLLKYK